MPTLTDTTVLDAFRRWGYLEAQLDPLHAVSGRLTPQRRPELAVDGPEAEQARRIYAGSIGVEFMHIADPAIREWVAAQMEAPAPAADRRRILERLVRAEAFEQMLQSRYLGSKRFSIEGLAALVPRLDEVVATLAQHDCEQVVLALSHRAASP